MSSGQLHDASVYPFCFSSRIKLPIKRLKRLSVSIIPSCVITRWLASVGVTSGLRLELLPNAKVPTHSYHTRWTSHPSSSHFPSNILADIWINTLFCHLLLLKGAEVVNTHFSTAPSPNTQTKNRKKSPLNSSDLITKGDNLSVKLIYIDLFPQWVRINRSKQNAG